MQSEAKSMIAASVQSIFSGHVTPSLIESSESGTFASTLWGLVEDNGLPLATCAQQSGGSGFSWSEVSPVLEAIGRWCVPLPLAETLAANWLLEQAGMTPCEGRVTLADSLAANAATAPQVIETTAGPVLTGELEGVAWAGDCRWLVMQALHANQTLVLVLVDLLQAGIKIHPGTNLAGEPRSRIVFDSVPCTCSGSDARLAISPLLLGALMRSTMICGALDAALEQTIAYVNQRVQFGKPLGKNQVIQQNLATLATSVQSAHMATQVALQNLSKDPFDGALMFDIAVAKIRASVAASDAFSTLHQVQGAIGFTREHNLQQFTRRLLSWRQEFGSEAYWSAAVGRAAIKTGGADFWSALTSRSFDVQQELALLPA